MRRTGVRTLLLWTLAALLADAGMARAGETVWLVDLYAGLHSAQEPATAPSWRLGLGGGSVSAPGLGTGTWQFGPVARIGQSLDLTAGPSLMLGGRNGLLSFTPRMPYQPDSTAALGIAAGGNLRLSETISLNASMGWSKLNGAESDTTRSHATDELFFGSFRLGLRF